MLIGQLLIVVVVTNYMGTNVSSTMALPFVDFNRVGLCGRRIATVWRVGKSAIKLFLFSVH